MTSNVVVSEPAKPSSLLGRLRASKSRTGLGAKFRRDASSPLPPKPQPSQQPQQPQQPRKAAYVPQHAGSDFGAMSMATRYCDSRSFVLSMAETRRRKQSTTTTTTTATDSQAATPRSSHDVASEPAESPSPPPASLRSACDAVTISSTDNNSRSDAPSFSSSLTSVTSSSAASSASRKPQPHQQPSAPGLPQTIRPKPSFGQRMSEYVRPQRRPGGAVGVR